MDYKFWRIASITLLLCCCTLNNNAMCSNSSYNNRNCNKKGSYKHYNHDRLERSRDDSLKHNNDTKKEIILYDPNTKRIQDTKRLRKQCYQKDNIKTGTLKPNISQQNIQQQIADQVMKSVLDEKNNDRIFDKLTSKQITSEEIKNKLKEIADNYNKETKVFNNIKPVTDNSTQKSDNNIANNNSKLAIYNEIENFLPNEVKNMLYNLKQYEKNSDEYTNFVNELSETLKNIIKYGIEIYEDNKTLLNSLEAIFEYFKKNSSHYYKCAKLTKYEKRIMLPIINADKFSNTYDLCMKNDNNNTNAGGNMAFCVLEFVNTRNEDTAYAIVGIDEYNISIFADNSVKNNSIIKEYTISEYDNNYIKNILTPPQKHMDDYKEYGYRDYYHSNSILNRMKYNNFHAWYFQYHYPNLTKYYDVNYFKVKLHETIDKSDENKCNFHNFAQDKEYRILLNILNNKKILYNVIQKYFNEKTTNVQLNIHLFTRLAMCPACWTVWHKYINELKDQKFFGNIKINEFNVYARDKYMIPTESDFKNPKQSIHPLFWYAKEDSSNNNKNQNEVSQKIQINQYHDPYKKTELYQIYPQHSKNKRK